MKKSLKNSTPEKFTGLTFKKGRVQIDQVFSDFELTVLNSIRDPFGVYGIDFKIIWINKSMAFIHQSEPEQMIGMNCYHDFCKDSISCGQCPIVHVRDSGRMYITERSMDFPDGKKRWGEVRSYPVKDKDRNILAVAVLVIETTETVEEKNKKQEYTDLLSKKLNENSGTGTKIKIKNDDITLKINLSSRETEVLRLLTEGYTNIYISELLSISHNTVKRHVDNIFNKLGVNDRTHAAVTAVRNKLV